ncbi:MAG: quinol:cytochrome C oxidoreductase [Acidobacteria bacterium]|nr:quinol:cytochrome C oxidoreductase [Acidobacteriota bacterium]MCY3933781.1 quinol:cytochrome C oxidoreductase [Acidobacteriota bacterium]
MAHGPRIVRLDQLIIRPGSGWARLPLIAGAIGLVFAVVSIVLATGSKESTKQFFHSWLVAVVFFLCIGLGCLFFVLIHHATKAGWGVVVRRLAENLACTVPVLAVLFIPVVALGMYDLFHWTHADAVAHDRLLQVKEPWLNETGFWIRTVIYFAVWSGLALYFRNASRRQDESGDEALSRRMARFSPVAVALFAVTLTFAGFDWLMSLEPHWYSTMFGVYFFAGTVVSAFAALTVFTLAFERSGHFRGVVTGEHFHDLGKLLFAFTVFWAYIAFSQFFLIWYANIPEETNWFLSRLHGTADNPANWRPATLLLAIGHFAVPFFFLMPRTIKRNRTLLLIGAVWMLAIHLWDVFWLVMPNLHREMTFSLLDVTSLLGVGGLFLATAGWLLGRGSLVPSRDPRLVESLAFENI